MKYWSKSNLKAKCRYGYRYGRSQTINSMLGSALHFLIATYLERKSISKVEFDYVCDKFSIPVIFHEEFKNSFKQWKQDIGDAIVATRDIICIESNDSEEFAYCKNIARVTINETYGLQGMFDLVCKDKSKGRPQVIDWKSGMIPDDPDFENICNGTLAYLFYKFDSVRATIYSIATGIYKDYYVNKDNIDDCLRIIDERIKKIEAIESSSEELPRTPNSFCFYCSAKPECPNYLDMLKGTPVFNVAATELEMIKEIDRLKTIAKACSNEQQAIDDRCKAAMDGKPPIQDTTHEYLLEERKRYDYEASKVYDILEEMGCSEDDLVKIIKISKKDLDELLKKIKRDDGPRMFKAAREVVESLKEESSSSKVIVQRLITQNSQNQNKN